MGTKSRHVCSAKLKAAGFVGGGGDAKGQRTVGWMMERLYNKQHLLHPMYIKVSVCECHVYLRSVWKLTSVN